MPIEIARLQDEIKALYNRCDDTSFKLGIDEAIKIFAPLLGLTPHQIVPPDKAVLNEVITIISDGKDIVRRSGVDDKYGLDWVEFETDHFAGEVGEDCTICGQHITTGWLCLDGGDCICHKHVNFVKEEEE